MDEPDLRQSRGAASLVRRVRANSVWELVDGLSTRMVDVRRFEICED